MVGVCTEIRFMFASHPFYLVPDNASAALVLLAAAAGVAAWFGVHRLCRRALAGVPPWTRGILRILVGWAALLTVFQALALLLVYTASIAAWVAALAGAGAVESVLALYGVERRIVPHRQGRPASYRPKIPPTSGGLPAFRPAVGGSG